MKLSNNLQMGAQPLLLLLLLLLLLSLQAVLAVDNLGVNWGLRSTHPLQPDIIVRMLRDNGITKVKLFEADPLVLQALGRSGIEVMVGIPNELLAPLAASVSNAEQWVMQNVSKYISKNGVDIRYVAVGNEPFLNAYKGMFQQTTYPALQNIQAALIKAGLGRQVRITVPLNGDVYLSDSGLPSGGGFRPDIQTLMLSIVKFLQDNGGSLTINIYPFLSLYLDHNFPIDFAFFGGSSNPIVDGAITYTDVFEASYDTLIWTLEKNGFSNMTVIVGEIGWPTDGDPNANPDNARKFNQGLINRILQGIGTPKRPSPPDIYIFGLIDEDAKSIMPGNFERHWGLFNYDGTVKYPLVLTDGMNIVPAKGVRYFDRQWCVLSPTATITDPNIAEGVNYACSNADCTSLSYGSSCNGVDVRTNISYAFNQFYQTANQQVGSCSFSNLSVLTTTDPSQGTCRFEIMIDTGKHDQVSGSPAAPRTVTGGGRALAPVVAGVVAVLMMTVGTLF